MTESYAVDEIRRLLMAQPVDVSADEDWCASPPRSDAVIVWRRHHCDAKHRSARTFLKCAIPRAAWVNGSGEYASIAWCRVPTVWLFKTPQEAVAAKHQIDSTGCGGGCQRRHQIVRVVLP